MRQKLDVTSEIDGKQTEKEKQLTLVASEEKTYKKSQDFEKDEKNAIASCPQTQRRKPF